MCKHSQRNYVKNKKKLNKFKEKGIGKVIHSSFWGACFWSPGKRCVHTPLPGLLDWNCRMIFVHPICSLPLSWQSTYSCCQRKRETIWLKKLPCINSLESLRQFLDLNWAIHLKITVWLFPREMKTKAWSVITNNGRTLSVKQSAKTSGGRELMGFINTLLLPEHVR